MSQNTARHGRRFRMISMNHSSKPTPTKVFVILETFEGCLDTSTPRVSLAVQPFPSAERLSDDHVCPSRKPWSRAALERARTNPLFRRVEGMGRAPSNFGNAREVSRWSSSFESTTTTDSSNSLLPAESEELTEALASSPQISPGVPSTMTSKTDLKITQNKKENSRFTSLGCLSKKKQNEVHQLWLLAALLLLRGEYRRYGIDYENNA